MGMLTSLKGNGPRGVGTWSGQSGRLDAGVEVLAQPLSGPHAWFVDGAVDLDQCRGPGVDRWIAEIVSAGADPGDVLVFYSDGLTDAPAAADGDPFEVERLAEVVLANHHRSAAGIHGAIAQAVAAHTGGAAPADDLTLVVVKLEAP